MNKPKTAILGGSGLYQLKSLKAARSDVRPTQYGEPSAALVSGLLGDNEVVFLPRHGREHSIPPHQINYRANMWALKEMGVRHVIAVAAVGGIEESLQVGDIVLPDQLLDYTYGREHTFFDGASGSVRHIDFSYPYDQTLIEALAKAGQSTRAAIRLGGVYATTQGPRLETVAEVNRIERDGGTVVGMTGMPEAALAREAGLAYVCLALVVNPAAGRADGVISIEDIEASLNSGMKNITALLEAYFSS